VSILPKLFEDRAITSLQVWGTGDDVGFAPALDSGVVVNQDSALKFTAVLACLRIIAETVASLPSDSYRSAGEDKVSVPRPPWMRMPNPETTWYDFVERLNVSLDLDNNAFVLITAKDSNLYPAEVYTLDPRKVRVTRERGSLEYVYGETRRFRPFSDSMPDGEVLHIKGMASGADRPPSPIDLAGQAIGLGLVAEQFAARFFGSGQTLSGVVELPQTANEKQTQDFVDKFRERWLSKHQGIKKAFLPGVLTGGAHFVPTSVPNDAAQMLESRKFQVEEICRVWGVPPHLVMDIDRSTSWGTGIEQQSIGFVRYRVAPRVIRLETALSQLMPRGRYLKLNLNGLLRGDMASRATFYAAGRQWGYFSNHMIQRWEDLPTSGDEEFLTPPGYAVNGEVPAGSVAPAPQPAA
jgi:HK97 family phage portal protein